MKRGYKKTFYQEGQQSDRIITVNHSLQMSYQQQFGFEQMQESQMKSNLKKIKQSTYDNKQKRRHLYLKALVMLIILFSIFIIGSFLFRRNNKGFNHQEAPQHIKAPVNQEHKMNKNFISENVNLDQSKKTMKENIPTPVKINITLESIQKQEQKQNEKIVPSSKNQKLIEIKTIDQKKDETITSSPPKQQTTIENKPTVEKKDQPKPASEQQLLAYVSEPRIQKGGNMSVSKDFWSADLRMINKNGKTLAEALYHDQKIRSQRETFHKQRIQFTNSHWIPNSGVHMMKYNMRVNGDQDELQRKDVVQDYERLNKRFHYTEVKQELPVCLIVRTYNNNAQFRVEYNLNSIFTQNYSNYMVAIVNDASTDGTDLIIRRYIDFFQIPKEKYVYISQKARKTALENTYDAIMQVCSNDSIVTVVDGDDELVGRTVFQLLNSEHQRLKGGWIYTSYFLHIHQRGLGISQVSKEYDLEQKKTVAFRSIRPTRNYHLRSFPARLFKMVPVQNFKDENGDFYKYTEDVAIFLPVMELACGHVYFVNIPNYLYNYNTGQNDWILNQPGQEKADLSIRAKKKLECLPEFKERPIIVD